MKLAINGGEPVRPQSALFPGYNPIGREEIDAVQRVMESGYLSKYLGEGHVDFYGGPQCQAFEKEWSAYFKVKHSVAMNSATSGLVAAVGAIGTEPGDEIIVASYSMVCSATAILFYGAVPVFCDASHRD